MSPEWATFALPDPPWSGVALCAALAAMGFAVGALGSLIGAGGGFILVPMLRLVFDKSPEIVAGSALALVAINGVTSAFTYRLMRLVDDRSAYLFAAAAVPGAAIAPFALKTALAGLPGAFDALFGALLLAFALRLVYMKFRRAKPAVKPESRERRAKRARLLRRRLILARSGEVYRYRFHETYAVVVNFALGFVSSFFGIGGGFLRVPILITMFSFPAPVATATSMFSLVFYATAGAATHLFLGNIEWFPTVICAGAGFAAGAPLGARLAPKIGSRWIINLLMTLIAVIGAQLIIQSILT